jgi:hypothetical protein
MRVAAGQLAILAGDEKAFECFDSVHVSIPLLESPLKVDCVQLAEQATLRDFQLSDRYVRIREGPEYSILSRPVIVAQ